MAKQLNISMNVQANTAQAKKNLEDLFTSLNKINSMQPGFGMKMSEDMKKASQSAQDLQVHLSKAMNVNTGNLDLKKLETSLDKSGQKLSTLMTNLTKAGPVGEQSFLQVARAVSSAGTKLTKTQGVLGTFLTTLKNTARWQLSSSLLHGFMGALRGSITYAEQLNKSLTNIRIVTGQSSDDMARFAEKANKAAQALSTTTRAYSDAALIYYQQGLDDKQVEERTNTTVKLANVTGQSAKEVSSQMTAVWNNFDDGTKSLESYADVMTALGATTASSSAEIAEGLSKFASVADTVGLSYNKAAASVATVVAETRQSADVVGTAFKTIFARLEGLKLGETLEDGVGLNKYSEALKTVGVNILDSKNQLKDMDTILDELNSKWQNIGDAQKVALAETVAGTRQYTQFLALMNNYDKVQANETTAENSEGTIQKQQEAYEQSWAGAKKRVQASLESIYDDMIPTDFMIKMTDGLSKVLDVVDSLIDSFGGLPNILMLISTILLNKFAPNIAMGIDLGINKIQMLKVEIAKAGGIFPMIGTSIKNSIVNGFQGAKIAGNNFVETCNNITQATDGINKKIEYQNTLYQKNFATRGSKIENEIAKAMIRVTQEKNLSTAFRSEIADLSQINNLSALIAQNKKLMTEEQRKSVAADADSLISLSQKHAQEQQALEDLRFRLALQAEETNNMVQSSNLVSYNNQQGQVTLQLQKGIVEYANMHEEIATQVNELKKQENDITGWILENNTLTLTSSQGAVAAEEALIMLQQQSLQDYQRVEEINAKIQEIMLDQTSSVKDKENAIRTIIQQTTKESAGVAKVFENMRDTVKTNKQLLTTNGKNAKLIGELDKNLKTAKNTASGTARIFGNNTKAINGAKQAAQELVIQEKKVNQAGAAYNHTLNMIKKKIADIGKQKLSIGTGITQAIQGFSQMAMGINAVKNSFETLMSEDASFFDKVAAAAMGLSMGLMAAQGAAKLLGGAYALMTPAINAVNSATELNNSLTTIGTLSKKLNEKQTLKNMIAENLEQATKAKGNALSLEERANVVAETMATMGLITARQTASVAKALENAETAKGGPLTLMEIMQTAASALTKDKENVSRGASIALKISDTLATWGLNAAMTPLLAITILLVAAMAALAAIIVGVILAVQAITSAYEADAKAAEDAENAAENLAEAYKKCKEEYAALQETISKRNDALDRIKSLTRGTREWRDAIREANEASRELIEKYHLKKGQDYTIDSDGIIQFNEGVEDRLQDEKSKDVAVAEATSLVATQKAKKARAKSDLTDLTRQNQQNHGFETGVLNWLAPGGGGAFSTVARGKEVTDNVARLTTGDLAEQFKNNQLTTDQLKTELNINDDDLIKSITDLAKRINENTEAEEEANELAAASLVAEDKNVQNSKNKEDLAAASGRIFGQAQKALQSDYEEKLKGSQKDSYAKDYLEKAGITEMKGYKFDKVEGDGTIKYKYKDDEGKEQTGEVKATEAASVLSTEEASEQLSESLQQLDKTLTQLRGSNKNSDEALADFISNGDFSKSNYGEQKDLQSEIEKAGGEEAYLNQKFGGEDGVLSDDEAKQFGYESAQAMVDTLKEKSEEVASEWGKITIDDDEYGLKNIEDMSLDTAKKVQSQFDKIKLGAKGEEGGKEYINGLNDMLEGVDPKDKAKALEELSSIDWSSYNALDQAKAKLAKFNVTLDTGSDKWQQYADSMRKAQGAVPDFTSTINNIKEIMKLTSNLESGKTIEEKDYNTLIEKNPALASQFQAQLDGSYKYIGSNDDLSNIKQSTLDDIQKVKAENAKLAGEQEKVNNVELKVDDENIDFGTATGTDAAKALVASNNADLEKFLKDRYDYDDKTLNELIAKADKGDKEALQQIDHLYKDFDKFKKTDFAKEDENNDEAFASQATTMDELKQYKGSISDTAYNKQLQVLSQDMLNSATTLEEFDAAMSEIQQYGEAVNFEDQSKALIALAENYENTSKEVEEYNKVISNLDVDAAGELTEESKEALAEVTDNLRAATLAGEAAEKYSLDADVIEAQAKAIKKANGDLEMSAEQATKVAIANQRMNAGIKTLHDNFEDWRKTLQTAEKTSMDYAQATADTTKAIKNLLAVSDDWELPDEFLDSAEHLDWLTQASKGSETAINKIGIACARSSVNALEFNEAIASAYNTLVKDGTIKGDLIDNSDFETAKTAVIEGIDSIQSHLDSLLSGNMTLDDVIDTDSFVSNLNQLALTTGMTVDEMNDTLSSIGVQAKVETVTVPKRVSVPTYDEYTEYVETGKTQIQEQVVNQDTGKVEKKTVEKPKYKKRTYTVPGPTYEVDGYEQIAQISTAENPISPDISSSTAPSVTYTGVGGTSNRGSTNRGGGVSTSSTTDDSSSSDDSSDNDTPTTSAASHEHEVHRYSNEENAINGLTKQYERLNKAKDKAFGASKIFAMEQELKALKNLKKASSDYLDAIVGLGNGAKIAQELAQGRNLGSMIASGKIGGTAGADYRALFSGADASGKQVEYTAKDSSGNEWLSSSGFSLGSFNSMFGTNLSFSLDSYGNIQNKDSILNLIQNLTNSENDAYSRIADPDAGSTTEHNKRLAYLEAMKERIEQYGETVDTLNDKVDEYLDRITEIQEKNAEIITAKLEQGVNLGQKTIQRLERSLKILGDNIYKTAEAMSKWYEATFNKGVEADKKQADSAIAAIADAEARVKLYEKNPYDENAISPEQAAEIIDSAEGTLDSVIDSLLGRVEEGKEYFGNVLDYWNEKFDKVNASIENNIKILDHFQNILSLLGKSADYGRMNILLEGQSKAAEDNYNSLKRQAEVAEQIYKKAEKGTIGLSGEALQEYKDNVLQKAYEDFQNAVDAMYSGLKSWIEIENTKFENKVSQTFAKTEDKLTGEWGGFDALDAAMSRQRSVAEEYLTKTNQLYETNSLMRKLSQDIDKTDSKIAKNKLKAFQDEIEAMKQQEKLSKTDLDIAKARYEVLQAELALEEAKNAKTTVRLQQDNEGNFGYVYTADQDQITDAEQILEDKQNALYNLGLQKAQEYGEKIISIRKEWQAEIDTVIQDWREGKISSEEELNTRLADINARYRELETSYLESYVAGNNVLNEVGAEGQTEAWTNSFNEIITEHRLFNDDSENALNDNSQIIKSVAEETTDNLLEKMSDLNKQRNFFEKEAEVGNSQLRRSVGEVTTSVSNLSREVIKKGGLADSMVSAAAKAQDLTNKFFNQYDALQNLINQYSKAANGANNFYQKMVDLINVQIAYNHAKNGATSVSWGPNGVHANYGGNNSSGGNNTNPGGNNTNPGGNNTNSGGNDKKTGGTPSSTKKTTPTSQQKKAGSTADLPIVGYSPGTWTFASELDPDYDNKTKGAAASWDDKFPIRRNNGSSQVKWIKRSELLHYGFTLNDPRSVSRWINTFKSGGYTGKWISGKTGLYTGSWEGTDLEENGKLAFLHQKELVLNATDTENMLEAVKLIRQISQQIDLQAISQSSGFSAVATQFFGDREPLQQDITIHAEFPNATDHNEIEQAFDNLANKAAQFANRY